MTSHHESCKPSANERIRQLKLCFKQMVDAPQHRVVLFGGDLNMRDKEVRTPAMLYVVASSKKARIRQKELQCLRS